jgi:predicted GH43/DUF377 family glycosyl hydrolase
MGVIYTPDGRRPWSVSHAALPVIEHREGTRYRVYYSTRDHENRARIAYFEIDITKPTGVLRVSESPVLDIGSLGAFDDSGVTSSCVVDHAGEKYQYYTGWTRGVTVPFYFYVGLAVSRDGGESFQRISAAPILERTAVDPYLTASPSVLIENGVWRMWYISCSGWDIVSGTPRHRYHIRYAESSDGIVWRRDGRVCIDYSSPAEYAFARPYVIRHGNRYMMWFSYRGEAYRIGYAESEDGMTWQRQDERAGIDVSAEGWDSQMIEYPCVFEHGGLWHMLYNGNGYGRSGIGYAVSS